MRKFVSAIVIGAITFLIGCSEYKDPSELAIEEGWESRDEKGKHLICLSLEFDPEDRALLSFQICYD